MEAPICLIESTKDGKLKVNAGAVEILSQITQPVTVVSIVGACRTGKSFLMNRLAGQQKGFDLGHTVQTKTKGIWMWCRPHPVKKDHVLVLLDTEGLGDVEKCNSEQDTWIFSLAVLLSDVLVYNSSWTINQDAINKLHFIKDITEFIKVKAKDNNDPETCVSNHFPEFIWALRDFVLKLEIDEKAVTQDEYLEHALKPQLPETTKRIKKMNKYKNKLSEFFKIRKCFTFDLPTCDKSVLQRLEDVHDDELTPSFIAKSKEFCDYVFRKDPIKYKGGLPPINGKRFGLMTVKYTESISSSNFICMENVIMNVSKTENKAAVQEATKYYEDKMKERIIFPTKSTEDFMTVSEQCEKEALQIFIDKSFQDEEQKFQEEFAKNVKQIKDEFSEQNIAASRRLCKETITALSVDLDKNLKDGSYMVAGGYQTFQEKIEEIEEKYNKLPNKGVQSEKVLQKFLKSKTKFKENILQGDKLSKNKKELEEREKAREKERERKIQEEKENEESLRIESEKRTAEEHGEQMLNKIYNEMKMKFGELQRCALRSYELFKKMKGNLWNFESYVLLFKSLLDFLIRISMLPFTLIYLIAIGLFKKLFPWLSGIVSNAVFAFSSTS